MIIGLASVPFPTSLQNSLHNIEKSVMEAHKKGCRIVCFPETYLPGMRGFGYEVPECTDEQLKDALFKVQSMAVHNDISILLPMEWKQEDHLLNLVYVIDSKGQILGKQTKNQLHPEEEGLYIPGKGRSVFTIEGLTFGIAICHEGWRYPETVRYAACKGAKIVFHPHFCGNDTEGNVITKWGDWKNPYYEKAIVMRSMENCIYMASINYSMKYQDCATCFISPEGECMCYQPFGESGVLTADIDLSIDTGFLAKRFKKDIFNDII